MVKFWTDSFSGKEAEVISVDGFNRVSCKIDAAMLLLMCHPSSQIRVSCLEIMRNLCSIQKNCLKQTFNENALPVSEILAKYEITIAKQATYGFLEETGKGNALNNSKASSLHLLSFDEVAASSYTALFHYYLGELAKWFTRCGRTKAIRHLAKYLKLFAIPLVNLKIPPPSQEFQLFYQSNMILLMAMAGIPITSDIPDDKKIRDLNEARFLLFGFFRNCIPFLLTLEKEWQSRIISKSLYFFHRDVGFLFVSELMQNFQEVRHNSNIIMETKFLDNLFMMLRYLVQHPDFEKMIEEKEKLNSKMVHMYYDFIGFTSLSTFRDIEFLYNGPISRLKTAINYSIIVQKLCACLESIRKRLQIRNDQGSRLKVFDATTNWPAAQRRSVVSQFKDWYDAILDRVPRGPFSNLLGGDTTSKKFFSLKAKLLARIGPATELLMSLGSLFSEEKTLPTGLLSWLDKLQGTGFLIFSPEFLHYNEDALGTILASSYGAGDSRPYCTAILNQILPISDERQHAFTFHAHSHQLAFSEAYLAFLHSLEPVGDTKSLTLIYPEVNSDVSMKIRQHLGSLLFFGMYNLMNIDLDIRVRSFAFVKELLRMFSPESTEFNSRTFMQKYQHCFYSGVGNIIQKRVVDLSAKLSELFPSDSGSFLWEAVRCGRSLTNESKLLVKPQHWIIQLMLPWCQFVNLGSLHVDQVNAEFFRFLMRSAFEDAADSESIINYWGQIASSPEYGVENASVLMGTIVANSDVVIEVCARFSMFEAVSIVLGSTLAEIQPDLVAALLTFHLSSSAFPWNQNHTAHTFQQKSQSAIKDFVASLYTSLNLEKPESVNDHRMNMFSATVLIARIIPQNFESFSPHLAIIINYVLIHIEDALKKGPSAPLITGLVEGYLSYIHLNDLADKDEYRITSAHVRKILGWLSMDDPKMIWKTRRLD
jgi:uncharacterized protein YhhL (DUF1145 family)